MRNIFFPLLFIIPSILFSQFGDRSIKPESWSRNVSFYSIPSIEINADDEAIEKLKTYEHTSYICATAINTSIFFSQFALDEILPNGDKVYRMMIKSSNAKGLMFLFENFELVENAKLWIYNIDRSHYDGLYLKRDNYRTDRQFLTSYTLGNTAIIEYIEPKNYTTPNFQITKVYHYFRGLKSSNGDGFGDAPSCILNARCSEGNALAFARSATCRIRVTGSNFSGFCTGTLVNNTSEDKTPYILTANHCSAKSNLSDLPNWQFDFIFESPSCSNPLLEPDYISYKGCQAAAYSGSDNGESSSDFLLLKMTSSLSTASYDYTFLGWDRTDNNFFGNTCFHHPKGDIKKVSISNRTTEKTSYGGLILNTHLKVIWTATTNGHSVTDEGSSGSGLINSSGLLVGTLTAGSAFCNNPNGEDLYGRFNFHWDKYGITNDKRLKPWLDPSNTGVTSLRSIKLSGATSSIDSKFKNPNKLVLYRHQSSLELNWQYSNYEVFVYNSLGQILSHTKANENIAILDFSDISRSSLYFIEVIHEDTREFTKIIW